MRDLAAYIPMDRRHALAHGESLPDRCSGAALFADVSGFTPLSGAFAAECGSQRGAEALLHVINPLYEALIAPLHHYGGSVISFGGDAITCWFAAPEQEAGANLAVHRAVATALAMQAAMRDFASVQTPGGAPVALNVKVALAAGPARRFLVGDPDVMCIDTLAGATLARMSEAEHYARGGEAVVSNEIVTALGKMLRVKEWRETFAIVAGLDAEVAPVVPVAEAALPEEQLRSWVLPTLREHVRNGNIEVGSLRPVTALFLKFGGIDYDGDDDAGAKLDTFVRHVQRTAHHHGGNLLQLIIGDKGAYAYAVFGAPVAHEDDAARAMRAALALRELPPEMTFIESVQMGLTRGNLWSGNCGATARRTYAAMGSDTNLSARLMEKAPPGHILISKRLATTPGFKVMSQGERYYKGFAKALATYELCAEQLTGEPVFSDEMVGRERELQQLAAFAQPLFAGELAGVALIYGEAGIGKSRLTYALREYLGERVSWFTGQTDAILQQPFSPFVYWLKCFFEQSPEATPDENRATFETLHTQAAEALKTLGVGNRGLETGTQDSVSHPQVPSSYIQHLVTELDRTRSFLGALLGLHWPGSLYEQLTDPQLRHENTLIAIKTLLLAESCRRPVVFELEDAHWLDAASRQTLLALSRNVAAYPLLILVTSRYADDASKPMFDLDPEAPTLALELGALTREALARQAAAILGDPASSALLDLLWERSRANPFFAQQLLLYLRENDRLTRATEGVWTIAVAQEVPLPDTLNTMLVARIDRLEHQVKETVQAAAVLGREFEVQVLSQVLQTDALPAVKQAEREQIWLVLAELRYLFRHALLRDAAYEMQLQTRLRALHRLAARAYEQVYAADLRPYYADLVYHHHHAENWKRERHYAILAGKAAATAGAYQSTVQFLSRALELTPAEDVAGRYDLLLAREEAHHLRGAREAQAADLEALAHLVGLFSTDPVEDPSRAAMVTRRQARYAEALSDYVASAEAARRAVYFAQAAADPVEEAQAHVVWGRVLWRQGEYTAAREQNQRGFSLAQSAAPDLTARAALSDNLANMGAVAFYEGDYTAAHSYSSQALTIFQEIGDQQGEQHCLNMLHLVAYARGNYGAARDYLEQSFTLCQKIGNRRAEAICLNNLGVIDYVWGEYAASLTYHQQALAICHEIGDRQSQGVCLGSLGAVALVAGHYVASRNYLQQALTILQGIGARDTEGKVLNGLGALDLLQGKPESATEVYQRALAIREVLNQPQYIVEDHAGLAQAALMQGETERATAHVQQVLDYLQENPTLNGAINAMWAFCFTWQVLEALNHPQADAVLALAAQVIQAQLDKISDPAQRETYLRQPYHHVLWEAWQAGRHRRDSNSTALLPKNHGSSSGEN